MKWTPRIRTVLLFVNIGMLLILLLGIGSLRIVETILIRQTETELNIQAAFVSALYTESYANALGKGTDTPLRLHESEVEWTPIANQLNMSSQAILDEEPQALSVSSTIAPVDIKAGQALVRTLQRVQKQSLASIRIVNSEGFVVSSTNTVHQVSLANRAEVQDAINGEHRALIRRRTLTHQAPSAFSISRRADYRVHITHPIFYEQKIIGAVVLSRTPEGLYQRLSRHTTTILMYIALILALTWLLASFTSITIHKPIVALMKQARRAQKGEKGAVIPLRHPISFEVMELSKSVANMAQTLEQRADYLMEFSSQLSHEFKTPVTAIQGAVELLIDHSKEMTEQRRLKFLHNIQKDAFRLDKLVYRLLDYAKADLVKPQKELTSPGHAIAEALSHYPQNNTNTTTIHYSPASIPPHKIEMNTESFKSILFNLLDNAVQAGASNISIECCVIEQVFELKVIDDGESISSANQLKIFDPFFTLHRSQGGTGLGLSIISALLQSHGGQISLACQPLSKAFTLSLPLAPE